MKANCTYEVTDRPGMGVYMEYGGDSTGSFGISVSHYAGWEMFIFDSYNFDSYNENQVIYTLYFVAKSDYER
tara:strand:+ start:866 stop:1081 length:216 start_codon:yes stop_codon:yes gene_type:complete